MVEWGPKQQSDDIRPITFQNDDPKNADLDYTGNGLVPFKPKFPL